MANAKYWQQGFEVLDDFGNSSNFPGDKINGINGIDMINNHGHQVNLANQGSDNGV